MITLAWRAGSPRSMVKHGLLMRRSDLSGNGDESGLASATIDFTISLPEEQAERLRELASESGVSPEQLLRAGVGEWLTRPGRDFAEAAAYVLKKNRELYRRLA
jgi:antitoxin FitA